MVSLMQICCSLLMQNAALLWWPTATRSKTKPLLSEMLTPFPPLLLDAHKAVFLLRASACRLGSPCTSAGLLLQGWDALPLEALSAPAFRLGTQYHTKSWAEKEAFGLTSDGDHLYCFCGDTLVNLPNFKAFQKREIVKAPDGGADWQWEWVFCVCSGKCQVKHNESWVSG